MQKEKNKKTTKRNQKNEKNKRFWLRHVPQGFGFLFFGCFVFFCSFFVFLGCPAQELFFHVFCFIFLVSFQINVEDVGRVLVVESFVLRRFPFEFWALGSLRSPCAGFA